MRRKMKKTFSPLFAIWKQMFKIVIKIYFKATAVNVGHKSFEPALRIKLTWRHDKLTYIFIKFIH